MNKSLDQLFASVHSETLHCQSEPFDKTCRRDLSTSSSRVAQGRLREESLQEAYIREILRRFTPQNDTQFNSFRMDIS
jgi:hypothetical protein